MEAETLGLSVLKEEMNAACLNRERPQQRPLTLFAPSSRSMANHSRRRAFIGELFNSAQKHSCRGKGASHHLGCVM